jgi:hypothetical protein
MATYKLIQDIEAEDKILGPLTLRQFIFALVTAFFGYLCFIAVLKHVLILLAFFIPPMLLLGFFAFPFGRDQPTEIWALAKLRFLFKPRKRMWDQSGIKELVTITVPKKVERVYTDGLSKNEVESRLKALANTIDSRGWATKNINLNNYAPNPLISSSDERLLDIQDVPPEVPDGIVQASDDILDEQNNPVAHQLDNLITASSQQYRQQLMAQMNSSTTAVPVVQGLSTTPWFFMGNTRAPASAPLTTSTSSSDDIDEALMQHIQETAASRHASYGNLRTVRPLSSPAQAGVPAVPPSAPSKNPAQTSMTAQPHPDILALATNNDLNVSTIARQAKKVRANESENNEVVISLH